MLLSTNLRQIGRAGKAARWPLEISGGDPEANGLLRLIVASPQGMIDLATGRVAVRTGSADPGRINADGGLGAYFDGVDDQYSFGTAGDAVAVSQAFTVVWESELDAFVDTYPMLAHFRTGLSQSPLRVFYSSDAVYDDVSVGYDSTNKHAFLMPAGISRTGERHWAVWSYNGQGFTTGANHRLWINGQDCAITTASSFAAVTDDNRVGGASGSVSDWNGSIRQVRLYDRAWEHAEAIRFWHPSTRDSLFSPPAVLFSFPTGGGAAALVGESTVSASASGSLTTQIPISGAATVAASTTGILSTDIPLSGITASVAIASGVLTASIRLSGAALGEVLASADLSSGAAALAGVTTAAATGSATLTTQINLSGAAVAQALAAAGLTAAPAGLVASAAAIASGTGSLSTGIPLVGQASAIAIGAGDLTTAIKLAGAAAAVSNATGALTVSSGFSASALVQAGASGTLSAQIQLNAAAVMQALAVGSLSGFSMISPSLSRSFIVSAEVRENTVPAETRRLLLPTEGRRYSPSV